MSTFDRFAMEYESALKKNLRLVPGGIDFYYRNRVRIATRVMRSRPKPIRILDFGAGIGLTIPYLTSAFPQASLTACDESQESIGIIKCRYPFVEVCEPNAIPSNSFDLIFVAGVIHHIRPADRRAALETLRRALTPGGILIIYELNPLNPVTRLLVRGCPFDEDAVLISKKKLLAAIESHDGFNFLEDAYMVFLPPIFRFLAPLEKLIKWCPLGAQYYLAFEASV